MLINSAMESNVTTTRHSFGIVKPLSKDMFCHRRTVELLIGMAMA